MTDENLNDAHYQPDHLWTGGKKIREVHKITSIPKKDVKPWLAKQALWQVHIPPSKEINHRHYNVTKPNDLHQFNLLYVPHNVFEGNTYKYILTCVDVASRYKVVRAGIYLLKVNNRNTRTRCEICSKLTIKTPERRLASFWCLYC